MEIKIRRIVTGHSTEGKAIFSSDDVFEPLIIPTGDAAMATIWSTLTVPSDCNDESDGRFNDVGTTLSGGSVIRIVDMLPGASSPMHRSNSIDYGVVLSGTIELELDDHQFKTVGPQEIIVQRGTIHKWRNPSTTDICRILFVLIEAKPFKINGKCLPEVME
ncbi:cupin domain-containing protein [Maribacter sp. 1_2014MBL_MicDiv]|uniref:cupin domain-containing protein n=1 Tax=Maribacter sp. 1_2014MBL_MicDiv TaxID=1644130 RepID=UPI0008F52994|nr:cupin domain-containing protein [Maribacter sp. 1_2014MBL_MicDiv]APA63706.1 cupin [Maribacter sp. 1_2014MBL_MicDiv]